MRIKELAQAMKTPQERGVLVNRLFGEPYIKEGRLYIKQNATYGRGNRLNRRDLTAEAYLIGLEPLTMKDICLDLIKALNNAGISNNLAYRAGLTDEQESDEMCKEDSEYFRKYGRIRRVILEDIEIHEQRKTSSIYLPNLEEVFILEDFCIINDPCSKDMRILPKVVRLNRETTRNILEAYKIGLEKICMTPFEEEYQRRMDKKRKAEEKSFSKMNLEFERLRKVEEKRLIRARKKPIQFTLGEKQDLMDKIAEQEEEMDQLRKEIRNEPYRGDYGTRRVTFIFA